MNWYRSAKNFLLGKLIKIASVSVYVSGFDYPVRLDSILDLCYHLHPIMEKFSSVLTTEELNYWMQNGVRSDFFSPDGDDFDKADGIMNVYVRDFPANKISWLVSEIRNELDKIDVNISAINYENFTNDEKNPDGIKGIRVIRFVISSNQNALVKKDLPPDLNMTGSNACLLASLIEGRLVRTDDGISLDAQKVINTINSHFSDYTQILESVAKINWMKPISDTNQISYISHRMPIIKEIAQWAVDHGFKEIYFV